MQKNYMKVLEDIQQRPLRKLNDRVLLVDGMNLFIRNFALVKSLNRDGHHVGGMVGFLRSLGYLVRILDPTRVIIVFEGRGGSVNRKNVDPNYKANRDIKLITNWGLFDDKAQEHASMVDQQEKLLDYLAYLPIHTISVDKLEADDLIAYLSFKISKSGKEGIIVSSDHDFYQLVSDRISIYSPIKKIMYTPENIQEVIGASPVNYPIVKALVGDTSDNLSGVRGAGVKTVMKEFPELAKSTVCSLDRIYEISEQKLGTKKIHAQIIDDWDKVVSNYRLMNLHREILDDTEAEIVAKALNKPIPQLQTGPFLRMLESDKVEGITTNTEQWLQVFSVLNSFNS